MVVKIIEPHLTPGQHARVLRQFGESRKMFFCRGAGVVRMDADRSVDPVVMLGEWNRGIDALCWACDAADREDRHHAGRTGALEHRIAVCRERVALQMRMSIDDLHCEILTSGFYRFAFLIAIRKASRTDNTRLRSIFNSA